MNEFKLTKISFDSRKSVHVAAAAGLHSCTLLLRPAARRRTHGLIACERPRPHVWRMCAACFRPCISQSRATPLGRSRYQTSEFPITSELPTELLTHSSFAPDSASGCDPQRTFLMLRWSIAVKLCLPSATGVPRSSETALSKDPTTGLCLGTNGSSRGEGCFL